MNQRVEGQESSHIDPLDEQEQMEPGSHLPQTAALRESITSYIPLKVQEMQRQLVDLERQNTELRNLLKMQSHESEKQYQIVLEKHHDGICLVNEQGQVIVWNEAIARITGIAAEDVLGKWIWDVQFQLMPEDRRTPETIEKLKTDLKNLYLLRSRGVKCH